MTQFA